MRWIYKGQRQFIFGKWYSDGEIIEDSKRPGPDFYKVDKKGKVTEKVNFDLNNDGKVDDKDYSIAGKTLASKKSKKGD